MASELIEKIKVFYFLTRGFADYAFAVSRFAECCPRRRDRGVGL